MSADATICDSYRPTFEAASSSDDGLRTAALRLLQTSDYASLRGLRCEVTEAVVVVQGVVPSYFLKQMAQTVIWRLDGIKSVTNLVEVRPCDLLQPVIEPAERGNP